MKTMPILDPLILRKKAAAFDNPEWIFELKYDGFRGLLHKDTTRCFLISKSKKHLSFPKLTTELCQALGDEEVILDGEIVCLNEEGIPVFMKLLRRESCVVYVTFDILWRNGEDLRKKPLDERKKILETVVKNTAHSSLQCASYIPKYGIELYSLARLRNLEGVVAKHSKSFYTKRSCWFKIKNPDYTQNRAKARVFRRKGEK